MGLDGDHQRRDVNAATKKPLTRPTLRHSQERNSSDPPRRAAVGGDDGAAAVPSTITEDERSISPVMTTKVSDSATMPNCGVVRRRRGRCRGQSRPWARDDDQSGIARPTQIMPSWLPCRSKKDGGAPCSSTEVAGRPASVIVVISALFGRRDEPLDDCVHCDFATGEDAGVLGDGARRDGRRLDKTLKML